MGGLRGGMAARQTETDTETDRLTGRKRVWDVHTPPPPSLTPI